MTVKWTFATYLLVFMCPDIVFLLDSLLLLATTTDESTSQSSVDNSSF